MAGCNAGCLQDAVHVRVFNEKQGEFAAGWLAHYLLFSTVMLFVRVACIVLHVCLFRKHIPYEMYDFFSLVPDALPCL